jgi:hypothetical protein
VQAATWREEFPADTQTLRAAARLVAVLAKWDDGAATETFAPSVDRQSARKILARLALDHGACTIDHGVLEADHEPLGDDRRARFHLACAAATLELTFVLDDTGRIAEFEARVPAPSDATCAP